MGILLYTMSQMQDWTAAFNGRTGQLGADHERPLLTFCLNDPSYLLVMPIIMVVCMDAG